MFILFSFSQSGLVHLRDVLFVGNPIYDDMPREQARIEVRTITMTTSSGNTSIHSYLDFIIKFIPLCTN